MRKVIITGANGFIGSALVEYMSTKNLTIYAIIKDEKEKIDGIQNLPGVKIVYCAMEEIEELPRRIPDRDIDLCIHLAWAGSFGEPRADYSLQLKNVEFSLRIVDVIAGMKVRRFLGAGTLAEKDVLSYHLADGAAPNPVSFYGCAKVAAHLMTKTECVKRGVEHIWCYLSNTYGPGNTTNNFVNMAAIRMLRGESVDFTSGEQSYDFVYVTDTVRAIYAAAAHGKNGTAYYLGSGKVLKLKDYIKMIRDAVDEGIELHFGAVPFKGNPLPAEAFDSSKLREDTGFAAEIPFEAGIRRTVEWLKDRK